MLKKINKKKMIILLLTLFIYIPLVFAITSYNSSDVVVDNTTTRGSIYLQDAIDEIDYACSSNHPKEYMCKSNTPKCIRATTLHTEECTNSYESNYCLGAGYSLNDTITYGNTSIIEGALVTGDAFDCDVNGDGVYDEETERFYFISDYYDTDKKAFNAKVAVLIYYSNTDDGVSSKTNAPYHCNNKNYEGPVRAMQELPTTTQWSNIRLYKEVRQILGTSNGSTTLEGTLPSNFRYSGYSARLLTLQELYHGCFNYKSYNGLSTDASLEECNFLFENTSYAVYNSGTSGSLLETPNSGHSGGSVLHIYAARRNLNSGSAYENKGVRPVIEILKSDIAY